MKKIIKYLFLVIIILFFITYLNKDNNYNINSNIISDEAIIRFEQDLKEGREIIPDNYVSPKKDYNNKMCIIGLKVSSFLEKIVNRVLGKLLDSLTS